MILLQDLLENPELYAQEIKKRNGDEDLVTKIVSVYEIWKKKQNELDLLRQQKNEFNSKVISLSGQEKIAAIESMKEISDKIKTLDARVKEVRDNLDGMILKIPTPLSSDTPVGKSDQDNPVLKTFGTKPEYDFTPKPYWELPLYQKYVSQEDGVKVMGSRGYYMHGDIAWFQKVLFDYALDIVLKHGFEMFYVPLMLNDKVLTGTGHLPDFDGQQYEVKIDQDRSYYLISSSEPSIMGYFMDKNLGNLGKPILATCWSSCFRQEAGSYGKDQQGILRVHQFEKIEMVTICKPEDTDDLFEKFSSIVEEIYLGLGLHFQSVAVCSGDLPKKHRKQIDYEAWFPGVNKYRENCSNGNAADYQNRGLRINYTDGLDKKQTPWGLNCTAITFRTGLAILEQFQQTDGSVKIPEVLVKRFGKEYIS